MSKDNPRTVEDSTENFPWEREVHVGVCLLVSLYWGQRDVARWGVLPCFQTERIAIRKEGDHAVAEVRVLPSG